MPCLFTRAGAWRWCLAMLWVAASHAGADSLTLTDVLRRTLAHSPALAEYPAARREADALALQAALRPAPTLGLDIENIAGSGVYSGADHAEYTLAISQAIEPGSKRERRIEAARWQQRGADIDYDIARADALAHAATRFVECARAQAITDWAQRRLAWAQRSVHTAGQRAAAGAGSGADVKRLEIAVLRARMTLARAQAQQAQAHQALAASWGAQAADFNRVQARLDQLPALEAEAVWLDRLHTAPQLERYATQSRLLAAQQQLADAQAAPDITVSLGVRRFESDDDNALVLGASMPLAFGARNRAASAIARAQAERHDAEQQRAMLDMRVALRGLYQQLQVTRSEALMLRHQALPIAQQALPDVERGYQAGRVSTLELITSQDEQLALEREAIDTEATFHLQQIALQQLTGQVIGEVSP